MSNSRIPVNLDGLVGPTHHYGGLSEGNFPSMAHAGEVSNPKRAALQGLEKMRIVRSTEVEQGVLPPAPRPHLKTARRLGYRGGPREILEKLEQTNPGLLSSISSASSMWAANIATFTPDLDSGDGTSHLTPANLIATFHRSLEVPWHQAVFERLFNKDTTNVHDPLPAADPYRDEGAANYFRLAPDASTPGLNVFVHASSKTGGSPNRYPARQSEEASRAIARLHDLDPERTVFLKQNPDVVDHGGFHNDLVLVARNNVLFHHERAFDSSDALSELKRTYRALFGDSPAVITVEDGTIPLGKAVESYLFNSQLIPRNDGSLLLLGEEKLNDYPEAQSVVRTVLDGDNPVTEFRTIDLRESMKNGGGPACLRLSLSLPPERVEKLRGTVLLTDSTIRALTDWVETYYPDRLTRDQLADPEFYERCRQAYNELETILSLPGLYDR